MARPGINMTACWTPGCYTNGCLGADMERRQSDRIKGRLLLLAFVMNLTLCALNTFYMAKFIGLVKVLGDYIDETKRLKDHLNRGMEDYEPNWKDARRNS